MSTKADELKLDIEEFNSLLQQATRQKAKDVIMLEIRRLQTELAKLMDERKDILAKSINTPTNSINKYYDIKLNNYGWEETNNAVKLYVELKDVHLLPKEAVTCNFTEKSLDLHVCGLNNKNYHLPINNLCEEINVEKSHIKIKTDIVVILLAKEKSKTWSHVTGVEKRIKDAKTPSVPDVGEDNDPSASLMNLIKKMYQDGDDEMKKTIAKAWTEGQKHGPDASNPNL